jgi:pilus assembly protein Flp/PilA
LRDLLTAKEFLMRSLCKKVVNFLKQEDGPTAVEYAVMLALIIVVCIAAVTTLGSNANETFSFVGSSIKPA